ncbi:hypothetical protein SAMD00019534_087520 [Acytostelium subglobosum LB1]|uniref:hypothetical protein n=1 Tax=Acytostelium subglobosum LB1 TaxID=1410327 RepID=UPI0006451D4B|nr:hypothetical protein SAMD00019534_087520 [Acytostelium subglobosum LB1]GAM25577.1 hypothetical protein SAMD00019534_087520 [Acytostelium subglobosum LB1]|eukprot:XP_012751563.1 hypothetical protein SAMD00019534_087520 [Acytostelium subglobosum LB1]
MPYKRNFRSSPTTQTSPLSTFLPTKPKHVINLFNSTSSDLTSTYSGVSDSVFSNSNSSSINNNNIHNNNSVVNASNYDGSGATVHSPMTGGRSSKPSSNNSTGYTSIKDSCLNMYHSIQNYFRSKSNVCFETDDLYEYRKQNTFLNNMISQKRNNNNSTSNSNNNNNNTTTLLTTTTTTTTTTTYTTSAQLPLTGNNILPPHHVQALQSDYLIDQTGAAPSFSKSGTIHLPSPCFKKTYTLPNKDTRVEEQIIHHQPMADESSRFYTLFNILCNFILQNSQIPPQDKYKAKLCIGFCLTVFSFIPSWIIFFWLSGLTEPAIMAILSLPMSISSLWVLRKTGSTHYPGHMLCFTLCFALTMNSYYTGGHQSTLRLLMSTLPIVSALVIGRRASVQWSLVVLFILLLFFVANLAGYEYVDGIPTITIRSHMNFIIDVTLVLITMSFTLCYQYFIDEAHRETKLKNQQLTLAKDAAVEAYQARQEFLATMSHEIRTPLNGLIGMATLLRDSMALPPEEKQMAKSVKSCGDILLRLVNDILDLSKLEANQMVVENIPFVPGELAHEICQVLSGQAKERNLSLFYEVSDRVPSVLCGDTGRILQVLMNLTGNALKFTPEGNVKIIIDLIEDDSEKISFRQGEHSVCFRVQDTGIGVPPESHQKIFEAFVQADPSDSRKYGGSGLGLYLCAKLVKLMRGEIGVYNNRPEQGGGSTFWFILPLTGGDVAALHPNGADQHRMYNQGGNGGESNIRVLVAEDNMINQRVAVKFLEKIGIKADVASNGNEVLVLLEKQAYDLIFMDFQMPILDGLRCSYTIRQMESCGKWPDRLPIFICGLTANTMSTDKKRCFDNGMNHFISKPFRMNQLKSAIDIAIEYRDNKHLQIGVPHL